MQKLYSGPHLHKIHLCYNFKMRDERYYNHFAALFTSSFVSRIIQNQYQDFLFYLLKQSGYEQKLKKTMLLSDLLDNIYRFLCCQYRCEYIYKNTLANNILLSRHSLKSSMLLSEFRVENSKVDLVIINGTSNAYEIKTELDSLDRLQKQVNTYKKFFDKVFIVTHEKNVYRILKEISEHIGILVLSKKNSLSVVREAVSNKQKIVPSAVFDSLTKKEYTSIIKYKFGFIPDVPNTKIYNDCKQLFCSLDPREVHSLALQALRTRNIDTCQQELVSNAPKSLKFLCMLNKLTNRECSILSKVLFSDIHIY